MLSQNGLCKDSTFSGEIIILNYEINIFNILIYGFNIPMVKKSGVG